MDSILIPTRPHLSSVGSQHRHLLLSHEMTPSLMQFYRRRSDLGDYLTLDNSAHEKKVGESLDTLLRQASQLRAHEVVVPDVLFDCEKTLYSLRTSLHHLDRLAARLHPFVIPKLMFVPQGGTKEDLVSCLWEMVDFASTLREKRPEFFRFTIGISKDYNDLWGDRDYLLDFIQEHALQGAQTLDAEIHLLGWPKPLPVLADIARHFDWRIRSTDSARPFTYALHGIDLSQSGGLEAEYPKRPRDFFDAKIDDSFLDILRRNISVYRNLAKGLRPL